MTLRNFMRHAKIPVITIGYASILVPAVLEVMRGNGAGIYKNVYGMQIHWLDVLTFAVALLTAFLIALALRWWQKRDDRAIDRLLARRSRHDDANR
jgi:hypothetical protein